ncbi:hypothetical protein COB11_03565 [Candidatus Aerophobetes bacterium]|uniref:Uncharacterized protein n=2 Tax=Aerophobetes bacterium TaxID=2030807 RepID=A0A2A4YIG5_UNCAE|nr:MAG: hypothetical protein COB11_03565 [Candidatus Aerophobetes bacterium]
MFEFHWNFYTVSVFCLIAIVVVLIILQVIVRKRSPRTREDYHKKFLKQKRDFDRHLKILKISFDMENKNLKEKLHNYEKGKLIPGSFARKDSQNFETPSMKSLKTYHKNALDLLLKGQEKHNEKVKEDISRLSKGYHTLVDSLKEEYKEAVENLNIKGKLASISHPDELANVKQSMEEKITKKSLEMKGMQDKLEIEKQRLASDLKQATLEIEELKKKLSLLEKAS